MRWVEKYRICTRVIMPLAMIYYAGFVAGHVAYYSAGHLGLFSGPFGSLREAYVRGSGPRVYASSAWDSWVLAALFLSAFLVERRRVKKRGVRSTDPLLQSGYFLAALWMFIQPQLRGSQAREAGGALIVLAAVALAGGVWRRWRVRTRAVAIALFVAGALLAAWIARRDDLWRLQSARLVNLQSRSVSLTCQDTVRRRVGDARVGISPPRS